MDSAEVISWTRFVVLFFALGLAAWMDHRERRVPNEFWITWSKPAIFLWTLDLLVSNAEWYVFATAAGVVAYASIAVIGRPTISDIMKGSSLDIIVSVWYLIGVVGIVQGIILHLDEGIIPVLTNEASVEAELFWHTLAVLIPIVIVDLAWRVRLLHGGADCKGLMWVAILIPSWSSVPVLFPETLDSSIVAMPPAIALLVWGGVAFLALPFIMIVRNLMNGQKNLRLIWHAERMDLDEILNKHVWLLSTIVEMPSGERKIVHKTRAPSRSPTREQLEAAIEELREGGLESAWVTRKFPLLVFLWPALLPLFLFGGPMALLLQYLAI